MSTADLDNDPLNINAETTDLGDDPPFPYRRGDIFWGYRIPAFRLDEDEHDTNPIIFSDLDVWVKNPRFATDGDEGGTYTTIDYDGVYLSDGRSINEDANADMQADCCWDEVRELIYKGLRFTCQ